MTETEFFKGIAADALHGAYYLYGKEPYSRTKAIQAAKRARAEAARALNVQAFKGAPAHEIINACETLPFFDERRLVVASEPAGDDALALADYAERTPESCLLLLEKPEPVKSSALFKTLEARGRTVEFAPYDEDRATAFLEKRARENGIRLERAAARRFVMLLGTDLAQLENALLRTADYVGRDNALDVGAVEACVTPETAVKVFEILDPLLAGNRKAALRVAMTMLGGGESAMGIAAYLEGAVRQLYAAKQLIGEGRTEREIVSALGGNPYAAKQTVKKAGRCDEAQLAEAIAAFADVGYLQVSGQAKDADTLLLALLKCFGRKTA